MLPIVLLCGLLGAAASPAQDPNAEAMADAGPSIEPEISAEQRAWGEEVLSLQREQALAWSEQPDARRKLAAAMFYPGLFADEDGNGPENAGWATGLDAKPDRVAWLEQAAELAPDDSLVAWAQAACTIKTDRCDRAAGRARLLRVDAGNAAAHLLAMDAAAGEEAARAHLAEAARATYHEGYFLPLTRVAFDFFRALPMPPPPAAAGAPADLEQARAVAAMAYVAAIAMPAFQPLHQRCLPDRTPAADAIVREDCVRVYTLMAADESAVIYPYLALKTLVALTEGEPEQAQWRDALRRHQWLREQWILAEQRSLQARSNRGAPSPGGLDAEYFRTLYEQGEIAAMRRYVVESGVALVPPDDWQPDAMRVIRSVQEAAAERRLRE